MSTSNNPKRKGVMTSIKNAVLSIIGVCACGANYEYDDGNPNPTIDDYQGVTEFARDCEPNLLAWINICRRLDSRVNISSTSRSVFKFLKKDFERNSKPFYCMSFFCGGSEGNLLYGGSLSLKDVKKLNMMTLEERVFFFASEREARETLKAELHSRFDSLDQLDALHISPNKKKVTEGNIGEEETFDDPFRDVEDDSRLDTPFNNPVLMPEMKALRTPDPQKKDEDTASGNGYLAESEKTLGSLAFHGIGQYYLSCLPPENKTAFNRFLKTLVKDPTGGRTENRVLSLPPNTIYKIDLSDWNKYSVRKGFERYGVCAFFGDDKKFFAFWWPAAEKLVIPSDPDFQKCALVFRSTIFAQTFLRESTCQLRWSTANSCLLASEKCLGHLHCVRRLLKPFMYQLANVNLLSLDLWGEPYSLGYRAFAFTEKSWQNMINDQLALYEHGSLSNHFKRSGLGEEMIDSLPMYKDGIELWRVINKFVTLYLQQCYKSIEAFERDEELHRYWEVLGDSLVDISTTVSLGPLTSVMLIEHLTNTIFWICAGGRLFDVTRHTGCDELRMPTKVASQEDVVDVQTILQTAIINKLRGLPLPPLIDSWYHMISEHLSDEETEAITAIYRDFQNDLKTLSQRIEKSNTYREVPYNVLDPSSLTSSLGV